MENPVLLIMRGLPGSGKSHFARNIHDFMIRLPSAKPEITSADDWFQTNNGGRFDHTQLGAAHNDCFRRAMHLMQDKAPLVVVDNANMTRAEISPYVMLGTALGYKVTLVHVLPPREYGGIGRMIRFDVLAQRNVHGVPESTIRNMADRWEDHLPYWREINIAPMYDSRSVNNQQKNPSTEDDHAQDTHQSRP